MAKKEETVDMVDRFAEFKELKNIDKTTMISVLEESFRSVLAKMFGSDENFDVIMNPDKGDCEIYQNLEVVNDGEVVDPNKQISISDVHNDPENPDPDCEVGEDYVRTIDFAKFGRRAILNLRQTLASKILDLQKDAIYNKFKEMEGELVTGEVYQLWKKEILLLDEDKNELLLPRDQQIPTDIYHKGDTIRAVIQSVDNKNDNPKIIVSRTSENFLRRLFEHDLLAERTKVACDDQVVISRGDAEVLKVPLQRVDSRRGHRGAHIVCVLDAEVDDPAHGRTRDVWPL